MYQLLPLEMGNPKDLSPLLKVFNLSQCDILDFLPEALFLVNTRWQIILFNRQAEEITGFSRDEVMGKFCWDIFRSDLCHKDCPMRISMSAGDTLVDREVEITTKSGRKIVILVNTARIMGSHNTVLGGVETFHHLFFPELEAARLGARPFADIVGVSPRMQEIIRSLPEIAASDSNVLIQGESGTGKELVARAIRTPARSRGWPST